MRQQNRRNYKKAFFYLVIFAVAGFAFNSLFITKKADGKSNPVAASLEATKTAALDTTAGGDLNGNNLVNPGDRLTYTITIPNSGADAALGVSLNDTIDANTTLVSGSVIASPIAVNDGYSSIGNVGISVPDGTSDLLANDLDANNAGTNAALVLAQINGAAFVSGNAVATTNGSVTVFANGSFNYTPNLGFEGNDTFTYTLSNGTGLNDTASVQVTVSGMIWFIKNDATACTTIAAGCGRVTNPFSSLAAFQSFNNSAGNNPAGGDNIFIYTGNASYDGSLTLLDGQKLIGQGANAALAGAGGVTGISIPIFSNALPSTGGTSPTIITTTAATSAINLGSNNTIRGITIGNTTGAKLNGSTNVGTLTVGAATGASDVILNGNGQALNLIGGGTLAARFASISSTNANQTAATTGITLTNLGGSLVSGATTITNPNGIGINVSGSTASAAFDFGNTTANQSGATGISLSGNSGAITFAVLNIAPDSGQRGVLATNNTGAITSTSGTVSNISNVPAVEITGASAASKTPLNIQLTSVSASGGAKGIVLTNTSSSGSPGGFTINGSGSTAGSGGTIQNTTNRGIELISTTNIMLKNMNLTNNATVNGDAVGTCANIGGGTNLNCSAAVHAVNTTGFSLDNVDVNGSGQVGVNGNNVTNFSMINGSKIRNCGNESNENGIQFANLLGTSTITGAAFSANYNSGLDVVNTVATAGTLNITNSAFTGNGIGTHGSALMKYSGDQTANMTVNVQSSSFNGSASYGYFTDTATTAHVTSTINNSTFGTVSANALGFAYGNSASGKIDFNVTNNTIVGGDANSGAIYMVAFSETGTTTSAAYINGTLDGNHIGTAGVVGSGCKNNCGGVGIFPAGAGAMNLTITNNDIRQVSSQGINLSSNAGTTGTLIMHIKHNTLAEPQTGFNNFLRAIALTPGNSAGASPTSCFEIGGSTAADKNIISGSWQAGSFIRVANQNNTGTTRFPGYGGSATDQAALNAFVEANNTVTPSGSTNITPGTGISGGAACTPTPIASLIQEGIIYTSGDFGNTLSFLNPSYQSAFASLTNAQANSCGQSAKTERILTADTAVSRQALSDVSASVQPLFNQTGTTELIKHEEIVKIANTFETNKASAPTYFTSLTTAVGYYFGKLNSMITPTAYAQKGERSKESLALLSGETISKSLGTLPPNEQIVVRFKATVNTTPANFYSVSNQGTVSAAGLSNVLTDDPAVAGAANPTVTQIIQPLTISKAFGASFISLNATTTLTFTITNSNPSASEAGVAFTDNLPSGLVVAASPSVVNNCANGTVTAVAGASSISYSGGTRPANTSCTIVVNVRGTAEGAQNNTTGAISSTEGGTGLTSNTATVTIINPPTLAKSFTPNQIQLNATSSLQFTLANPNTTLALNTLAFSDSLPAGITAPNTAATTVCADGSYSITNNVISFTKPTLAAATNCVFSVTVTGTTAGLKTNMTGVVTTANSNSGTAATANLTVIAPPTISKAFAPTSIVEGGTSTVTLTLSNPNTTGALTGAAFTDALVNMTAAGGAVGGTCAGTTPANLAAGATALSFTGITISNNGSCTVTFAVKSSSVGTNPNTTSGVATNQTPVAGTTSNTANLTVIAAADLTVTKTHTGNFTQGDTGKTYTITIKNSGGTPTSSTVTVTDTLPGGLTATAISGTGWSCTLGTLTCTRNDVLNNGASYPAMTLTVNVSNNAPASVTNTATVSGGGELNTGNNTANDSTTITSAATYTISGQVTNGGAALQGVNIALSGASTTSTVTDASGNYSFSNLASGGNYTVMSSLNGYTFNPSSSPVSSLSGNQTGINFSTTAVTYEGDAAPRPAGDGDGTVNGGDITVIRKFVAGIETPPAPADGSEFQRVDNAPLYDSNNNPVKGDGAINGGDITQIRRYAAGLDAVVPAGGPAAPVPPPPSPLLVPLTENENLFIPQENKLIKLNSVAAVMRDVRPVKVGLAGNVLTVGVYLNTDPAAAAANTVDFTLLYDTAVLSNPTNIRLGGNAPAATTITPNALQSGKVGIVLDLPVTGATTFPTGDAQLVLIDFTVAAVPPATTTLSFGNSPVAEFVGDINGNRLTTSFSIGSIVLLAPTAASVTVGGRVMAQSGRGVNNVIVSMTDSQGQVRRARTNPFGYYRFYDVPAGEIYIFTAKAKRYEFVQQSQVLNVSENTFDINFYTDTGNY